VAPLTQAWSFSCTRGDQPGEPIQACGVAVATIVASGEVATAVVSASGYCSDVDSVLRTRRQAVILGIAYNQLIDIFLV
jgi:hypothetical protein